MTNYDREYDPPPDDGVFDAADDADEEEGSRLPLLIIIALVVLVAFAGVVWLAYSQGVERGRTDAGGVVVAQRDAGATTPPSSGDVVKPYEQPAPADEDIDSQSPAAPAAMQSAASSPVVPARPPAVAPAAAAVSGPPQSAVSPPAPAETPAAKPAEIAAAKPAAAPPAAAPAAADAAAGGFALQIGAYKSQAEADTAWNLYKSKHAALVSSYSPDTVKADLGPKGTWYRLRIGPFSNRADAAALCEKLKADGGTCFLAK